MEGTARGAGTRAGEGISAWLESLLPRTLVATVCPVSATQPGLARSEEGLCAGAVSQRRAEFAAGRTAARQVLTRLGLPGAEIPRGTGGAPVWPKACVGSITHDRDLAIAVVADAGACGGIGIDLQPVEDMRPHLWPSFLNTTERQALRSLRADLRPAQAAVLFCLKEAFFKCQYPLTGEWLDFTDLEIAIDGGGGAPVLSPLHPSSTGYTFHAVCGTCAGYAVGVVWAA